MARYVRIVERSPCATPYTGRAVSARRWRLPRRVPLALVRCGVEVTLVEEYDYYYGAFDELQVVFLEGEGVPTF